PGGVIHVVPVPRQPLLGVDVADAAGTMHALDPHNFVVDSVGSRIAFAPWTPMQPGRAVGGIVIEVRLGEGDTADAVPAPLRQAILMLVAHWYEQRGVVAPAAQEIPQGVAALLAPFRRVSL
ncbi:MAG: head-tail connector protein, partial [Pseudolabrys sp.]